jgi:hypothetical protein
MLLGDVQSAEVNARVLKEVYGDVDVNFAIPVPLEANAIMLVVGTLVGTPDVPVLYALVPAPFTEATRT